MKTERSAGKDSTPAPVTGERERIVVLFNYMGQPGYQFSDEIHKNFFGRVPDAGTGLIVSRSS